MTATVVLPADLAPSLRAKIEQLVTECGLTHPPEARRPRAVAARNHCHVCRRGGKLGGHHRPDGSVVYIHKRCHRRLHQAGRG